MLRAKHNFSCEKSLRICNLSPSMLDEKSCLHFFLNNGQTRPGYCFFAVAKYNGPDQLPLPGFVCAQKRAGHGTNKDDG